MSDPKPKITISYGEWGHYTAQDFGPSIRWIVFVCSNSGHPSRVGYAEDEYSTCDACGAQLLLITVRPVSPEDDAAPVLITCPYGNPFCFSGRRCGPCHDDAVTEPKP